MYPHSKDGWRQFPGISTFAEVATLTLNDTYDGSSAFSSGSGLRFKPDGTEMYVMDKGDDQIEQFTLSSAWDITTATATGNIQLTGPNSSGNRSTIIAFKSDGTEVYWTYNNSTTGAQYLMQWTLSVAWDITSATVTTEKFIGSFGVNKTWIGDMKADGTEIYMGQAGLTPTITTYTLGTPYDASTITASADDITLTVEVGAIGFNSSFSEMYAANADNIFRYDFSTPYTLATGSLAATFDDSTITDGSAITVGSSDAKVYAIDSDTNGQVVEFDVLAQTGRGAICMDGVYYAICSTGLFSVTSAGVTTNIGTIVGTDRVVMETDGVQLVITTANTIYVYTVAGGLVTVTDADVEDTAKSSAYLDLAFYLDQASGQFIASANNDATSYSDDDKIEAESFADDILRMFAHNQLLYAFGETSTEVWYTSGTGRPPITRQQYIERGVVGTHAVASIDDTIFFVDQFRRPNAMSGLEYKPIYTPAVAEAWDAYTTDSDCIVTAYSYRQQVFVEFIFPTDDASWTYHVSSGEWTEREDTSNNKFRSIEYVNCYDKLLALDHSSAKVYQFAETTYTDSSVSITRTKDVGVITSEIFGDTSAFGNELICNSLRLTTESTGAATLTISLAKDGGAFAQSRTMTLTAGTQVRELNAWGKFREGIFRITTTSDVGVDLVSVSADLEMLDG